MREQLIQNREISFAPWPISPYREDTDFSSAFVLPATIGNLSSSISIALEQACASKRGLKREFSVPSFLRPKSQKLAGEVVKFLTFQRMYNLSMGSRLDSGTLDREVRTYFTIASQLVQNNLLEKRRAFLEKMALSLKHEREDIRSVPLSVPSAKAKRPLWLSSLSMEAAMAFYRRTGNWAESITRTGLVSKESVKKGIVTPEGLNEYILNNFEFMAMPVFSRTKEHFSLLVWYSSDPSTIFHYDSCSAFSIDSRDENLDRAAFDKAARATDLADLNSQEAINQWRFLRDIGFTLPEWIYYPSWSPKQESDWECGHHLIVYVIILSKLYISGEGKVTPLRSSDCPPKSFAQASLKEIWRDRACACSKAEI